MLHRLSKGCHRHWWPALFSTANGFSMGFDTQFERNVLVRKTKAALFRSLGYTLLLFIPASLSCGAPRGSYSPALPPAYYVLVAGEGIPVTTDSRSQVYPLNRSEAAAMARGAALAFSISPSAAGLRRRTRLQLLDDRGVEAEARKRAQRLQFDPSLLAVIGHSSSGTTAAAATSYEEAGIPLLMPIATSPSVRSRTAFRLPLDDRNGQAPALADFVLSNLNAKKVSIVADTTEEARKYTDTLTNLFRALLPSRNFSWSETVDSKTSNFPGVAESLVANHPDVIVFVGYASTAVLFLEALNKAYAPVPDRPTLVLTDGSISEDIRPGLLRVFLSSPAPVVTLTECNTSDARAFLKAFQETRPNFESFGYDAILILGQALEECENRHEISRSCLVFQLQHARFQGICNAYVFQNGENQDGQYTIYSVTNSSGPTMFQPKRHYLFRELRDGARRLHGSIAP